MTSRSACCEQHVFAQSSRRHIVRHAFDCRMKKVVSIRRYLELTLTGVFCKERINCYNIALTCVDESAKRERCVEWSRNDTAFV